LTAIEKKKRKKERVAVVDLGMNKRGADGLSRGMVKSVAKG